MTSSGIDVNAFPPELPPNPDTDDLEPEAVPDAPSGPVETTEAQQHPEAAEHPQEAQGWPPCDYCGGEAHLAIVYRQSGEREFACYPCHGAVIARALNEAADQAEAVGQ